MNTSRVEVLKTTGYEKTALKGSAKIWKAKRSVIIETKWQNNINTKTTRNRENQKKNITKILKTSSVEFVKTC